MLPIQFLKKYFPNTPDWILGGMFLTSMLWIIILPVEIIEIVVRQGYTPENFLGWFVKFLYILGYVVSLFMMSPIAENSTLPDQFSGIAIVILGLAISSPAYFTIGALLAARNATLKFLGTFLGIIYIILSCFIALWFTVFLFSA